MGVEYYTTRFLLQARAQGCDFGRVLTIGRQNLQLTPRDLDRLAREFKFNAADLIGTKPGSALTYIEPVFENLLKAASVESLDVSTYEGATHVHDMNAPLPERFHSQYDTILEAGSLEHIFNLPTALKNLMQAVKVGGSIFIQTPANNYFGHGFYQFSPELFYRVFSAESGFELRRMHLFEHFYPCFFFATKPVEVTDPAAIRKRVQLVNNRPTLLLIEARKIAEKPIFAATPQQSDYVPLWHASQSVMPTGAQRPVVLQRRWQHILYALPLKLIGRLSLQYLAARANKPALSNRDFFKPTKTP
jgi:SAM-dependent methyltransferase